MRMPHKLLIGIFKLNDGTRASREYPFVENNNTSEKKNKTKSIERVTQTGTVYDTTKMNVSLTAALPRHLMNKGT